MQSICTSPLFLPSGPVASDGPLARMATGNGEQPECAFTALMQGQGKLVCAGEEVLPSPAPSARDTEIFALALPPFAATGKILPASGKDAAASLCDEATSTSPASESLAPVANPVGFPIVPGIVQAQRVPEGLPSAGPPNAEEWPSSDLPLLSALTTAAPTTSIEAAHNAIPASGISADHEPNTPAPPSSDRGGAPTPDPLFRTRLAPAASPAPVAMPVAAEAAGPVAVTIAASAPAMQAPTDALAVQPSTAERISPVAKLVPAGEEPIAPQAAAPVTPNAGPATRTHRESADRQARDGRSIRQLSTAVQPDPVRAEPFERPVGTPAVPFAGGERSALSAVLPAVPVAAASLPDRAEAVASVVERLFAAREAGLGSIATVAIGHREFGDLRVSFATGGPLLEVSVTAADSESQQALAAALSTADRPAAREFATPAGSASSQPSGMGLQDRGAEGQSSRDAGNRQARENAAGEQRRAMQSSDDAPGSEPAAPKRSGIFV